MRSLPIDCSQITFLAVAVTQAERRLNPDDRNSPMTPKVDENGQLLWRVQTLVKVEDPDAADAESVRGEILDIEVPSNERPKIGALDEVEFDTLAARPWSMNGTSGVSFRARGVTKAGTSNGRRSAGAPPVPAES